MDHDPSLVRRAWMVVRTVEWCRLDAAVRARAYELLVPPPDWAAGRRKPEPRVRRGRQIDRRMTLEIGG
jgi:hypothetical protein